MRQRSLVILLFTLALLLGSTRAAPVAAQDARCFGETGQCISGRFRAYWEQNGGLPVFGFPITPAQPERNADTGQTYLTQWFQRNRFELHPENAAPYDVLLGRLGNDRLVQQGRDWFAFPKADPNAPHYYGATGHAIAAVFWGRWSSTGLDLGDPGVSERESLALFGMPLSEPALETNASGDTVLTQWFERARFEHHPANQPPYDMQLGLLGNEVRTPPAPPPPPPSPSPTPPPTTRGCKDLPANKRGEVRPRCIQSGDSYTAIGHGMQAGERVRVEINTPSDQWTKPVFIKGVLTADNQGSYTFEAAMPASAEPGIYRLIFKGQRTAQVSEAYVRVLPRDPSTPPGQDHSQLPPNESATIDPQERPHGDDSTFTFVASGFKPDELVHVYLTSPHGDERELYRYDGDHFFYSDGNGRMGVYFGVYGADGLGNFSIRGVGSVSGHVAKAYFRVGQ